MMMDLPYSSISLRSSFALSVVPVALAFSACLKVAEYSKEKPSLESLLRYSYHTFPDRPRCPSSTSTRLFCSKLSTETVLTLPSSLSLFISMTMTSDDEEIEPSLLSNISAEIEERRSSSMCCRLIPSFGARTMILLTESRLLRRLARRK